MTTESQPITDAATSTETSRSRFVWYDLITTDVPAATAFYTQVAGWGTQDFDMGPGGTYQMWTVDGVPIGGAVKLTEEMGPGMPPHWNSFVSVDSVDDAIQKVLALGGSVHTPATDIPTVGRFAVIADPQGASISLFTPTQTAPVDGFSPKLGEFSWHELMTSDHRSAFRFYSGLFGWGRHSSFDMGQPMGEYLMFGPRHEPVDSQPNYGAYGGMMTLTAEMAMPPGWLYYVRVPSVDAAVEQVKSLGGRVLNGPMDVPGGDRIAQCADPQGAAFAVHSTNA